MKRSRELAIFALTATILLVGWGWWKAHRGELGWALGRGATCEARCLARDPDCAALAATQGGYPGLELAESDRRAMCNGLCYVMRAQAKDKTNACIQ
ncbi:hypothetical protein LBMAG42_04680 [Deltaproteobacteria bacterium]|nr:hypothetical protein LBMAG42_04680 [Deltaproteobacteria bacterium]